MIKQCVFCYDELDGVKSLRAWPLHLRRDWPKILPRFCLPAVYCAVAHEVWGERLYPPQERSLPGRLIGKGFVKRLSQAHLLRSLRLISGFAPIDFLLFAPQKKVATSQHIGIEKALEFSKTEIPKALKRHGGVFMYVHDEDNTTVMSRSGQILFRFYQCCLGVLECGIEKLFVGEAWRSLRAKQGQAQVVSGYQKTLFFRYEPETVLSCNQLGKVLNWDVSSCEVHKAGRFTASFMQKEKHRSSLRSRLIG